MKHTLKQYTIEWAGATSGVSLTPALDCAMTAPFIVMDQNTFKGT